MPIEGYSRGTPDLYPRGSDKCLSLLTSSPRICRACRPTTRRHFAHTAIALLCEMAKRRLLRCSLRTAMLGLCRALSALRSCSGTGLRAAARGPRCSTGGGWSAGSAGRSHAPSGDGVALGRGIEHASNSPRRLRAIEHASRYSPRRDSLRQIRGEELRCHGTRRRRAQMMDRQAGRNAHASSEPKTRQCRAPDQPAVKATRLAGGRTRPTLTAAGGVHA
jgi:hypothetical protein